MSAPLGEDSSGRSAQITKPKGSVKKRASSGALTSSRALKRSPATRGVADRLVGYRVDFLASLRCCFRRRVLCLFCRFRIFCLLLLRAMPSSCIPAPYGSVSPACRCPGKRSPSWGGRSLSETGGSVEKALNPGIRVFAPRRLGCEPKAGFRSPGEVCLSETTQTAGIQRFRRVRGRWWLPRDPHPQGHSLGHPLGQWRRGGYPGPISSLGGRLRPRAVRRTRG